MTDLSLDSVATFLAGTASYPFLRRFILITYVSTTTLASAVTILASTWSTLKFTQRHKQYTYPLVFVFFIVALLVSLSITGCSGKRTVTREDGAVVSDEAEGTLHGMYYCQASLYTYKRDLKRAAEMYRYKEKCESFIFSLMSTKEEERECNDIVSQYPAYLEKLSISMRQYNQCRSDTLKERWAFPNLFNFYKE